MGPGPLRRNGEQRGGREASLVKVDEIEEQPDDLSRSARCSSVSDDEPFYKFSLLTILSDTR